jgi:uncharacterized protein (TIGR00730 family)
VTSLCVFCGSSSRVAERYRHAAGELGAAIAKRGMRLVYGGGRIGLMGILADAALDAGGEVVGVIPEFLRGLEVAHEGLTELRVVPTMHERKRVMFELADAFAVLPGGIGTLDESIEIASWKQLGLHDKPIVVCDVEGFWRPLAALVDHVIEKGFVHPDHARLLTIVPTIDDLFRALDTVTPPRAVADAKWT